MTKGKVSFISTFDGDGRFIDNRPISEYEATALGIGALVTAENRAYGDTFRRSGEIMKILYPGGIKIDQFEDALVVIRILDCFFLLATNRGVFGESPWEDITTCALLRRTQVEKQVETDRALRQAVENQKINLMMKEYRPE